MREAPSAKEERVQDAATLPQVRLALHS